MPASAPAVPTAPAVAGRARLAGWLPRAEGLSVQDWTIRHRVLICFFLATGPLNLLVGVFAGRVDGGLVLALALTQVCCVAALLVRGRRPASVISALGGLAACAGLVEAVHGVTEAHFSFFVVVAALALYRDWVPFLVFLVGTAAHHALMGVFLAHEVVVHEGSPAVLLLWVAGHTVFVLLAAVAQVLGWQLAEVEQRRSAREVAEAEEQFVVAFEHAPFAMMLFGRDGEVLRANRALAPTLGVASTEAAVGVLQSLRRDPKLRRMVDQLVAGELDRFQHEVELFSDDDERRILDVRAGAVRDRDRRLRSVLVQISDVTATRLHAEQLRHQVAHDPLTGLFNRLALGPAVHELITLHGPVCLVLVDVNRFSALNDRYGRTAGDELLVQLAARLQACAPVGAVVARISGDQFAVALAGDVGQGLTLARNVVRVNETPFALGGESITISTVAGVATVAGFDEYEHALTGAEVAAARAKTEDDAVQLYDDGLRQVTLRRIAAEHLLRDALAGDAVNRLPVWFQPIVDLKSGRTIGAEALVRMRSAEGALVSPGDFIPVAEETGLVVPLGEHVLRQALAQLMTWGDRLGYVSVNVSPRQLASSGFVATVTRCLAESGLAEHSRVVLEITEPATLGDAEELRELLGAVKALGVRIALDDFGTGYSSLTWLQKVPADIVKLDRSFVAGLAGDADKASIISAVIWLARSLRMSVIAEGVEDEADAAALEQSRCLTVQGYLFGRPTEPAGFEQYLGSGVTV